jgi:hypothetical protein
VDQEVAKTLGELEFKLRELERELTSIGQSQTQAGEPLAPAPGGPQTSSIDRPPSPPIGEPPPPPVSPPPTPAAGEPMGRLVDEAVEQRFSMEARETVYGEIPATKDRQEAIDLAELVRFKETMQRTLQSLIDQYSRLLSLEPPSHD